MQRAFVTGGSGFVGRALIAELVRREIAVRALARSDEAAETVRALGAEVCPGDVDDVGALARGMQDSDVVFHAAAYVRDTGALEVYERVNVQGTAHVVEAAKRAGVRRLVHIGTEAVLADGHPIVRADELRSRAPRPIGPYPSSKAKAEAIVLEANGSDLATVVVRPRFIWGAGDTSVLPRMVEVAKQGRWAWIGGGRYLTSTCHVDNVVEGTLLAAQRGRPGQIYFLTDGPPVEYRTFVHALLQTQGACAGDRSIPRWLVRVLVAATRFMREPPLSATAYALMGHEVTVDDSKARRELGYQSLRNMNDGLDAMRREGVARVDA